MQTKTERLAELSQSLDLGVRRVAFRDIPRLSGPELLDFAAKVAAHRSWGRGLRNAISLWYNQRTPDQLVLEMKDELPFHAELLRWTHVCPRTKEHNDLFKQLKNFERHAG